MTFGGDPDPDPDPDPDTDPDHDPYFNNPNPLTSGSNLPHNQHKS